MTLRRVNVVILVLLAVAFLVIVQRNLLNLNDFLRTERKDEVPAGILPFEAELPADDGQKSAGQEIPVLITASEERLGAVIAAMNSIYQNTEAKVMFTIATMEETEAHLDLWLSKSGLKHLKYKVFIFRPEILEGKITHDPEVLESTKLLSFVRFYLPMFIPDAEKAIYLDDDVIVQGDIKELYETKLKPGHAAAFSDDCDSASSKGIVRGAGNQHILYHQNNYMGFLDFKKDSIKSLGMRANTCSFNPGVIVANLTEWKHQNITLHLEHWMELNVEEDLYSKTLAESMVVPPLLIVFYKHYSSVDPMWHVRHLGNTGAGNRYSAQFVKAAKLLHWNGHYKPWGRGSSFTDVWDKWYIPDPAGKFHPVRKQAEDRKD